MESLAARLRAAAGALGQTMDVEAGWLRGAAELLDRGEAQRTSTRAAAVWLEELVPEARARKAFLLSAWVGAAEALRAAIHGNESERGPLAEALFPDWRGSSLRRHADQALAAEVELERRLASGYVARRLAEAPTETALRPALEALDAARQAWAAERDRPALAGAEADEARARLLTVAGETARLADRIRWVARAALADRSDLAEVVFPRRTRPSQPPAANASSGHDEQAPGSDDGEAPAAALADDTIAGAAAASPAGPRRTRAGESRAGNGDGPASKGDARPGTGNRHARAGKARPVRRS
ncbi:MAG TPA: hypothetical protein VMT11_03875 [Myxococcaceae bacterium]|nr:hypothetical protein [Myxococcaceae bacterium]